MKSVEVLLPIASALLIYVLRVAELKTKRDTVAGRVKENVTFLLFFLCGSLMLASSIAEFLLRGERLFWPNMALGWFCAVSSMVIRRRAIAALGRFWSLHVEIRENHQFVRSGPFRWMRHPTYFSMILELLSFALILNAAYSLLIIPFGLGPLLLWRLKLEETALVEKFGDTYREYQRTTPALVPYKWPTH